MTPCKPWLLVPLAAVLLSWSACSGAEAGGQSAVSCATLCRAATECTNGDVADYAACLEACAGTSGTCREETGEACLACWKACAPDSRGGPGVVCPETACYCDPPGQPGDPCLFTSDCQEGSIRFAEAYCVGEGPLRVSLSFDTDSDFDLHVLTPSGLEIYYATDSGDGGTLDVDQCVSPCGIGGHVENIVFRDSAPSGPYQVWVVNYDGRASGGFRVEVVMDGARREFTERSRPRILLASQRFRFTVSDGD